ncbi:MAG: bifunctional methylenetetrahydrofolate dehydrogenase/methenyltetrahydrofolate cyclohydrolase FolD [bacterium]|nr:bifunctional methylenetetrahydrofolate dehydrogenase/methenyltetrahydrofolate cyclohydrolase FolD [bacterium]MDE0416971.1 bifunctional methylenetetrahydrofolate dehydrogenase/methenyltetrahydrofolate cyclohydrolase FolD [bacterium]
MGEAMIIDGKAIALEVRRDVAARVARLTAATGVKPGLAVVLVGEDPASDVYVRSKGKATREAGMESFEFRMPASSTADEVLAKVAELNASDEVNGILVQLPLPDQVDEHQVIDAIDPLKDVDGFHAINTGRLSSGQEAMVPCTPLGCQILLRRTLGTDGLKGANAVIVGRSNIVGKPMAQLLLQDHCTVTIAHSRTRDLPGVVRRADVVVAAVGRPEMVRGDWIRPGATVIDVGVNRLARDDGRTRLVGDVCFSEAAGVAGAITPVPGGVGPMTIACLLVNTLHAACRQNQVEVPEG